MKELAENVYSYEQLRSAGEERFTTAEARRLHTAGVGVEEAGEQARFGDLESWTLRSSQGSRPIQQVYMELNGELP